MKGKPPDSHDSTTAPVPGRRGEGAGEVLPPGSEWRQLDDILQQALDLQGGQRESFLEQACRGRDSLRRQVETLLAHEETAQSFAEAPYFPRHEGSREGPSRGDEIGPYRLVEQIAQGGMGAVWRGVRVDQEFEQQVAIKVLRRDKESAEILSRFRHERQILARLNHPHIAKLLDGGTTQTGPFFIMEFVEGKPFDRHCREGGLSLAERLALFRTICGAVAHAHRNLVIHRDLKPANILVTAEGAPILLDFGIAKILSPEALPPTQEFPRAARFASPGYGAPEQLRGGPISVATDVFSLGVLLHVAATGREPPTHFYPIPECWPRPSKGSCDAPALPRDLEIPKDLEAVVHKAMSMAPEDRYDNVRELSEDVRRFLSDEPVSARKGSLWYQAAKNLKRNSLHWMAALACSTLLGLLGLQTLREKIEEATTNSLANQLMATANQAQSPVSAESFARILDESLSAVLASREQRPAEKALILENMGKLHRSLGDPRRAKMIFEDSLELRRRFLDPQDPFIALSLQYLAYAERDLGNLETGVALLEEAREMRLAHGDAEGIADVYNDLAYFRRAQGRFAEAVELYRQALDWSKRAVGEADHPLNAAVLNNLGTGLREMGLYAEARPLLEEAVAMRERLDGKDSMGVVVTLRNLGHLYLEEGRIEEAGRLFRRTLEIRREGYGERSHPSVAKARRSLALYHLARGDLEEADRLLSQAMQVFREQYPGNHFQTGGTLRSQAAVRQAQGRPAEARSLAEEGLRILRAAYHGADHWQIADLEAVLAGILLDLGERDRALPMLDSARERLAFFKGEHSLVTLEAQQRLQSAQLR